MDTGPRIAATCPISWVAVVRGSSVLSPTLAASARGHHVARLEGQARIITHSHDVVGGEVDTSRTAPMTTAGIGHDLRSEMLPFGRAVNERLELGAQDVLTAPNFALTLRASARAGLDELAAIAPSDSETRALHRCLLRCVSVARHGPGRQSGEQWRCMAWDGANSAPQVGQARDSAACSAICRVQLARDQ